jgi:hypothetical protein
MFKQFIIDVRKYIVKKLKVNQQTPLLLSLSLMAAKEFSHVTRADQGQLVHPYSMIMSCPVRYSVSIFISNFLKISLKNDKWFYPESKRWTSPFKLRR